MKPPKHRLPFVAGLALLLLTAGTRLEAATQTQNLNLSVGWNAVWLEVEPSDPDGQLRTVDQVFTSSQFEIDIVARPLEPVGTAEFLDDPASTFNQPGWLVWHKTPASGENDLILAMGNQAYLVHVQGANTGSAAGVLSVAGTVRFFRPTWIRGTYNLVGFGVSGAPTFDAFFAAMGLNQIAASPSDGSAPAIQRLDSATGAWLGANGSEAIKPGMAYWIWVPFALKNPNFSGPVSVQFSGASNLDFGRGPGTIEVADPDGGADNTRLLTPRELTFSNGDASLNHRISIQKVLPGTTGTGAATDELRLYPLEPKPETLTWQIASSGQLTSWTVVDLPPQSTKTVTVGAHRNWSTGEWFRENLYRIDVALDGGSAYFWLPAWAENQDLLGGTLGTSDGQFTGLWVGEVILDEVTSVTENGRPLRTAPSSAPVKLLIHVGESGSPSLLSHVMLMQTKTADPSVAPARVLVVDETKIPFYEGIEERNGKRIGRRLETTSYDLPRKMDTATQSALAAKEGLTTEDAVRAFVNGQSSRPPTLAENYALAWPLAGGLGPDAIVRTSQPALGDAAAQPLRLDPFHRSNPFRHAFHPHHGAGFAIERHFSIAFDPAYEPGLLRGTYLETITGLTAFPLQARGAVTLQRISTVGTLQ